MVAVVQRIAVGVGRGRGVLGRRLGLRHERLRHVDGPLPRAVNKGHYHFVPRYKHDRVFPKSELGRADNSIDFKKCRVKTGANYLAIILSP